MQARNHILFISLNFYYTLTNSATKTCEDLYGDVLNQNHIETLVEETNTYYGARELEVENVVFVNGDVDPWHTLGRLTNLNEKSPAILIPGKVNYCLLLYFNYYEF
jgi:hypothetical protein